MTDGSETFDCTVTDWEYIYALCREVADQVRTESFEPDVVVALARGGWFAGRCLCDFLDLRDLVSFKLEHYVGAAERADEPEIRYPAPEGAVAGRNVLVVDDVVDTGKTFARATEHLDARDPAEMRTAALQAQPSSAFEPDYVGEHLAEQSWVIYPWNFVEDMVDLVGGVLERADGPVSAAAIERTLAADHGLGHTQLEIAAPGRLDEVLAEMHRRGVAAPVGEDAWQSTAE